MQDTFWNISCRCTNVHYTWLLILNITQTTLAFQLVFQLTSSLLTTALLIIMPYTYEIDCVFWHNRLLIWIVILNAIENPIIFKEILDIILLYFRVPSIQTWLHSRRVWQYFIQYLLDNSIWSYYFVISAGVERYCLSGIFYKYGLCSFR